MVKYLYGAAVQGIQSFIFQTNRLKEIVGASELIEQICTSKFRDIVGANYSEYEEGNGYGAILHAAGNIKYVFNDEAECERIVRIFPKIISEFAPGITISQAVVVMEEEYATFPIAVNELERRLRIQRNRPTRSATLGMMGIERSRQTGLPGIEKISKHDNTIVIDAATKAKLKMLKQAEYELSKSLCNKAFGLKLIKSEQVAYDIEKITCNNDWIAIVHADGNGLGQIVQAIGKDPNRFHEFSASLDKATKAAAVTAYNAVKCYFNESEFIPIRPVVLSGDDFTVICQAEIALDYVGAFISAFEDETNKLNLKGLSFDHLTACAGVAFIKSSFPFYYGYELAEALCSSAKKDAKKDLNDGELPKSCLMFHKVQDSFTENWDDIVKRELTPQENISFEFGPYYIKEVKDERRWLLKDLIQASKQLGSKEGNAVKSHLRKWMSLLHDNPEMAKQHLDRLKSLLNKGVLLNLVEAVTKGERLADNSIVYPVYDILALHTINSQITKKKK